MLWLHRKPAGWDSAMHLSRALHRIKLVRMCQLVLSHVCFCLAQICIFDSVNCNLRCMFAACTFVKSMQWPVNKNLCLFDKATSQKYRWTFHLVLEQWPLLAPYMQSHEKAEQLLADLHELQQAGLGQAQMGPQGILQQPCCWAETIPRQCLLATVGKQTCHRGLHRQLPGFQ